MAKILLVKVQRDKTPGRTHFIYPPEYDAKKIHVSTYEGFGQEGRNDIAARGGGFTYLIGVVKDEAVLKFLESKDITELSYDEAIITGSQWRDQVLKLTDQDKVVSITQKIVQANPEEQLSNTLTARDLDALDPDSSEPGINRSKSFKEGLDARLAKKVVAIDQ